MKTPALLSVMLLALSPMAAAAAGPAPAEAFLPTGASRAGPAGPAPVGWEWPLTPRPTVLRAFDPPPKPWLSGHRGVDLRAAHDGAAVSSPASGTVSFVGVVVDRPVITVDHGNGLRSSFEPVDSGLARGAAVAEGDVLGWSQPGHCGPIPCVHWGVRRGEEYLNPLAFVTDLRPSVLLPPLDPAPG
jgi:murein DD-endopeptidase MepM/ murein hydrolase activator NlpD